MESFADGGVDLAGYDVSRDRGFLPLVDPLVRLPGDAPGTSGPSTTCPGRSRRASKRETSDPPWRSYQYPTGHSSTTWTTGR